MSPERWSKSAACTDPSGRAREIAVFVDEAGRVGITAPPGETGLVDPRQVEILRAILAEARVESIRATEQPRDWR